MTAPARVCKIAAPTNRTESVYQASAPSRAVAQPSTRLLALTSPVGNTILTHRVQFKRGDTRPLTFPLFCLLDRMVCRPAGARRPAASKDHAGSQDKPEVVPTAVVMYSGCAMAYDDTFCGERLWGQNVRECPASRCSPATLFSEAWRSYPSAV